MAQQQPIRDPQSGVTLIEMLVSLAIFALVGLASFTILDTLLKTRAHTQGRLDLVAEYDRALVVFDQDVLQSQAGSVALSDATLGFRDGAKRQFAYSVQDGAFVREITFRSDPDNPIKQVLIADTGVAAFRVLASSGNWHDQWPVDGLEEHVVAVEVEITLPSSKRLLRLVKTPQPVPE